MLNPADAPSRQPDYMHQLIGEESKPGLLPTLKCKLQKGSYSTESSTVAVNTLAYLTPCICVMQAMDSDECVSDLPSPQLKSVIKRLQIIDEFSMEMCQACPLSKWTKDSDEFIYHEDVLYVSLDPAVC